jgi:dienelactone hydrolase
LGFSLGDESPCDVRVERRWQRDGLAGEEISWSVGYGPRTRAWLLKPAGATGSLPGVLALHDHGGYKFYGKEKIAEGPDGPAPAAPLHFAQYYGDRAFANALAHEGFVVLVPDTFMWGSRRFPFETMPPDTQDLARAATRLWDHDAEPGEIRLYNVAAGFHEHLLEKYCRLLGTTLSGMVGYEDRVAANYLAGRPDVRPGGLGAVGLSGGGLRTVLLQATCERIVAASVVGLMSTYDGLLDHNVATHTWMLFPADWSRHGDWPDLAACRAPSPLLVQYDLEDDLFTVEGMRTADACLAEHYASVGHPENYTGQFYPGPHKFDLEMQAAAFAWLAERLGA